MPYCARCPWYSRNPTWPWKGFRVENFQDHIMERKVPLDLSMSTKTGSSENYASARLETAVYRARIPIMCSGAVSCLAGFLSRKTFVGYVIQQPCELPNPKCPTQHQHWHLRRGISRYAMIPQELLFPWSSITTPVPFTMH